MNKVRSLCFFMLLIFFQTVSLFAAEELSASDWRRISEQRKIYFTLDSMELFQRQGVVFRHTLDDYILWMDNTAVGVGAKNNSMSEIFESLVEKHEIFSTQTRGSQPMPLSDSKTLNPEAVS